MYTQREIVGWFFPENLRVTVFGQALRTICYSRIDGDRSESYFMVSRREENGQFSPIPVTSE